MLCAISLVRLQSYNDSITIATDSRLIPISESYQHEQERNRTLNDDVNHLFFLSSKQQKYSRNAKSNRNVGTRLRPALLMI